MASEARRRANQKYDQQNTRQVMMKLNIKTDADILQWLDAQGNKQGAIKQAIRDKIGKKMEG